MAHLGFRIAYNGQPFSGFQLQPVANTVQAELEKAFAIVFREKNLRLNCTSRTDAGVHAYDQWVFLRDGYAKYEAMSVKDQRRLKLSINGVLPESIRIWEVIKLKKEFNPKDCVEWKEYHYQVLNGRIKDPLLDSSVCWVIAPLDLDKIKAALKELEGTHDFSAFAKQSGANRDNKIRTILKASVQSKPHPQIKGVKLITFKFRGTAFLHNMVRNMVGTLIKIGQGDEINIKKVLESKNRTLAGKNAPANALILAKTKISQTYYKSL
jgi:tRNA pseudouridine38-40 synthase